MTKEYRENYEGRAGQLSGFKPVSMRNLKRDDETGFASTSGITNAAVAKPVVDTREANNVKPLKFSNLGNSALIGGISASTSNGNRGGGGSSSFKASNPFQMDTNDLAVYLGQVVGRAVIKVRLTGEKLYESSDDEIRQALGSSIAKVLAKNRNNRDFADKLKNMDVQETSDFLAAEIKARVLAVRLTGASLRNADPQEIIDALGNTAGKEVKRLQQEDRDGY